MRLWCIESCVWYFMSFIEIGHMVYRVCLLFLWTSYQSTVQRKTCKPTICLIRENHSLPIVLNQQIPISKSLFCPNWCHVCTRALHIKNVHSISAITTQETTKRSIQLLWLHCYASDFAIKQRIFKPFLFFSMHSFKITMVS